MANDLAVETMQSMADLNSATPPHICAVFVANSAPSALRGRRRLHAAEARRHAQAAIKALADIVNDEDALPPSRISAASEPLDRGFGRAPQSIDLKHKHDFSADLSAFLTRLHRQETGQVVENHGGSGLIDTDDATDVEFDEVVEE